MLTNTLELTVGHVPFLDRKLHPMDKARNTPRTSHTDGVLYLAVRVLVGAQRVVRGDKGIEELLSLVDHRGLVVSIVSIVSIL